MANCRSCGAEIEWLKTKTGANMPVDKNPVWVQGSNGPVECFRSHFETCPNAALHKKGSAANKPVMKNGQYQPANDTQPPSPELELPF